MKREETFVLLISYLCKNYWKYMPKRLESCISFNITSSTAFYNPIALTLRPSWERKLVLEKKNKGHITSLIISRTPMFENIVCSLSQQMSVICSITMSSLKTKYTRNLLRRYAQDFTNLLVAISAAKLKSVAQTTCTYEAIQETLS